MAEKNSRIDELYKWIAYDLQRLREELITELKLSSVQIKSVYEGICADKEDADNVIMQELRFGFKQTQNVYDGLSTILQDDIVSKMAELEKLQGVLTDLEEIKYTCNQLQSAYENLSSVLTNEVAEKMQPLPTKEEVKEIVEESVSVHNQKVLDAIYEAEHVDYDRISGEVGDKLMELLHDLKSGEEGVALIDYERVAGDTAEKVVESLPYPEPIDYLRLDETIQNSVSEAINLDALAELVAEKLMEKGFTAAAVVEEVVEEPVEEPVVEEVVEEVAEPVEEVAVAEVAVATEPVLAEDGEGQLIDAETGLVIRLKRSFTAKMKQSDEEIKGYYSAIKNALTSYARINSTVSWGGDRFNFGRDTIAKIGINGKTLCFYLDLDPEDPELKSSVYHQKNVGGQKAYESTPFMVKIKSAGALKKALRLVETLATKLGAEKEADFVETDYAQEFTYETDMQLLEEGYIKATKEAKVDFNF